MFCNCCGTGNIKRDGQNIHACLSLAGTPAFTEPYGLGTGLTIIGFAVGTVIFVIDTVKGTYHAEYYENYAPVDECVIPSRSASDNDMEEITEKCAKVPVHDDKGFQKFYMELCLGGFYNGSNPKQDDDAQHVNSNELHQYGPTQLSPYSQSTGRYIAIEVFSDNVCEDQKDLDQNVAAWDYYQHDSFANWLSDRGSNSYTPRHPHQARHVILSEGVCSTILPIGDNLQLLADENEVSFFGKRCDAIKEVSNLSHDFSSSRVCYRVSSMPVSVLTVLSDAF